MVTFDTQISQEPLGNRENPRFFIEIGRFSWKIHEKSWILTIANWLLGNLGVEGDHPPKMCAGLERTADRGRLLPYRGSDTIGRASPVHRKRSPRFALKNVTAFHKSDPQIGQILLQEPAQKRTFCLQKIPHMQRACAFEAQHDATKNKCDCLPSENGYPAVYSGREWT